MNDRDAGGRPRVLASCVHAGIARGGVLAAILFASAAGSGACAEDAGPIPTLHVTDLFRPPNDPDDHWDLATQYALTRRGSIDLCGILIDHPPSAPIRSPDLWAVAQMNHITGRAVPVMVGSPRVPGEGEWGTDAAARDPPWLRHLTGPVNAEALAEQNRGDRNMWCTAGFLHAAGLSVTGEGKTVPANSARAPVFVFDPVRVTCSDAGVTEWAKEPDSKNRFILRVTDVNRYPSAMTAAMKTLLSELP